MIFEHVPVLLDETIHALNIIEDGIYVDCTLGGAGHSHQIIKRLSSKGLLIGIDQDINAIEAAKNNLKIYNNAIFIHDNFSNIKAILSELKIDKVDGILMDLGVSSHQLDEADRGFSYMHEAPLDMRMDREKSFSAYNVVNEYSFQKLFNLIRNYGEEKFAKRIAEFIVEKRNEMPIETTLQLVDIIKAAIPAKFRREGPHPAKRTFQAIRIEVNQELEILQDAIEDSVDSLNVGGRVVIISFHSLEDRIVKNSFRSQEKPCICPKEFPVCACGLVPKLKLINKKPVEASSQELELNPRSRSAKLRCAERI
ncbi:MAG TPA: 16S rRNA (cytosine(1402)-N(4))-methyltransferase RsmH [Clostridiaceae bacterium]